MAEEVVTGSLGNSVDELNRKYREEAEKAAKKSDGKPEPNEVDELNRQYQQAKPEEKVEPNEIDELNRQYQDGEPTAAAQTEQAGASLNPDGGLEEEKK